MATRLAQPDSLKPRLHLNNTATELTQFATDLCDISHGKKKTNKQRGSGKSNDCSGAPKVNFWKISVRKTI